MVTKTLTVMRHGERESKDSEEISQRGKSILAEQRETYTSHFGEVGLVIPSTLLRTQNTAREMSYDFQVCSPVLASSVEQWGKVPWGSDFRTVQESYMEGGPTRELGDTHADFYRWVIGNTTPEHKLLITHDTRGEAALAAIVKGYHDLGAIGPCLDNGESYTLMLRDNRIEKIVISGSRRWEIHTKDLPLF